MKHHKVAVESSLVPWKQNKAASHNVNPEDHV